MKFWNYRIGLLAAIAVVYLTGNLAFDKHEDNLTRGDSGQYYLHVLSFFLYDDVGDYDRSLTEMRKLYPNVPDPRDDIYGIRPTETGRYYIKYTTGTPLMEAPFFLLAHAYAKIDSRYPANGWSEPYQLVLNLGTLCYLLVAFYWLAGILERYFSRRIVVLTCLTIAFATNLFYHGTYVIMSHGFLFFDYCLLLLLTLRFYERPGIARALSVGLVVGLIGITRVPEIISVLIPVLWGIKSRQEFFERIRYFLRNFHLPVALIVGVLLVFSIQFTYWYYVSGKLVFNPYQGEGFNFLEPKIHRAWFDFSNGWLIYTPVMAFSLVGLWWLRRYVPGALLPVLAFVGLHCFIHYSYYAWTFFPGLGQRPMVETYPLLALGLAACYAQMHKVRALSWLPVPILLIFSALNLFQTWQMKEGIIWSERHNRAFYVETFGATQPSLQALRAYDSRQIQPDSSDLSFLDTIVTSASFSSEQWDTLAIDSLGRTSILPVGTEFATLAENLPLSTNIHYVGVSLLAFATEKGRIWHRDKGANLMVEIIQKDGKVWKWAAIKPGVHIGNPGHSIWTMGEVEQWGEAGFFMKIPKSLPDGATLKIYIFNPDRQALYIDDLVVTAWQRR